jgi:hypothetical protein
MKDHVNGKNFARPRMYGRAVRSDMQTTERTKKTELKFPLTVRGECRDQSRDGRWVRWVCENEDELNAILKVLKPLEREFRISY